MMTAGTGHERRHTGVACARPTRRWARRACLFLVLALCVASTSARKREDKGHDLVRQAKKLLLVLTCHKVGRALAPPRTWESPAQLTMALFARTIKAATPALRYGLEHGAATASRLASHGTLFGSCAVAGGLTLVSPASCEGAVVARAPGFGAERFLGQFERRSRGGALLRRRTTVDLLRGNALVRWLKRQMHRARLATRFAFLSCLGASAVSLGAVCLNEAAPLPASVVEAYWRYALWAVEKAGPTFVKLAQWASTRAGKG